MEQILTLFDNAEGFGWATSGGSVRHSRDGDAVSKAISSGEHWAEARFHRDALLTRGFEGTVGRWNLSGQHTPIFEPKEPTAMWSDRAANLAFRDEHDFLYPVSEHRLAVHTQVQTTVIDRDAPIAAARFSSGATRLRSQVGRMPLNSGRYPTAGSCEHLRLPVE
jgi:hypothetical protein